MLKPAAVRLKPRTTPLKKMEMGRCACGKPAVGRCFDCGVASCEKCVPCHLNARVRFTEEYLRRPA